MSRFMINSQSVLLIIHWDVSMFAHFSLIRSFAANILANNNNDVHLNVFDTGYCLPFFLYLLLGLLADIKVGRYTSNITGVYLSFLSCIICGLALS